MLLMSGIVSFGGTPYSVVIARDGTTDFCFSRLGLFSDIRDTFMESSGLGTMLVVVL